VNKKYATAWATDKSIEDKLNDGPAGYRLASIVPYAGGAGNTDFFLIVWEKQSVAALFPTTLMAGDRD
jgi:hypothetical protein